MIYIHVPFCHRKCTYCAFYSKPVGTRRAASAYVNVLLEEMHQRRDEQNHPIKTVYFGGGTPSLLPVGELQRIVDGLRRWFDLRQVEEVTLEANPEDLTPAYLEALASMGFVNRLSIGVQSLDDNVLQMLNRRHTARQALEAVENARAAGFHNISVDFIYGIKEGVEAMDILDKVTHVSAYALTVEPGTALARQVEMGRVVLPSEEEVVRQYYALRQQLKEAGFEQYEVSNYARPGFRSRHNSRYWDRTPYLGLGAAAHSFDGTRRRWNVADVDRYIATRAYDEETLSTADAHNELLMTALRTTDGLPLEVAPMAQMQRYIDCGWLLVSDGRYRPTPEGLLHADGMAADLFV